MKEFSLNSQRNILVAAVSCFVLIAGCLSAGDGGSNKVEPKSLTQQKPKEVVVYTSTDQDYSEPVLRKFEKETGIRVKAVYDTETTKTVGLVNRLIAEKDNPQADVFWNNEVTRTLLLQDDGILEPYISPNAADKPANMKDPEGRWTGFSARARVLIVNTKLVNEEDMPTSILNLTDPKFKDRVCLGNPILGSTAVHVAALFTGWGREKAQKYFTDLKDNGVRIVESNGMVKDEVVSGECYVGLTDTDDANDAVINNKSVKVVYPDQDGFGTLVIPNSAMLIKGGPNPENGKKLIDYLLGKEAEGDLAASKAAQMPLGNGVLKSPNTPAVGDIHVMNLTLYQVKGSLEDSQRFVQETLLT